MEMPGKKLMDFSISLDNDDFIGYFSIINSMVVASILFKGDLNRSRYGDGNASSG
jgi:hypothetical protein